MADGSSGGLGGVLFEAGKNVVKATGTGLQNQASATANAAVSSLTGSQKPLFNAKPQGSTFPAKPLGGQLPKQNPFGNLGNLGGMFEKGAKPPFGAKAPTFQAPPSMSQAELDVMAKTNQESDAVEIAKRQEELRELQQKTQAHQQQHNEIYFDRLKNIGAHTMEESRQAKAQQDEQDDLENNRDEQAKKLDVMPGGPLAANQQLGNLPEKPNMATQQAMTKREANRGSTG